MKDEELLISAEVKSNIIVNSMNDVSIATSPNEGLPMLETDPLCGYR